MLSSQVERAAKEQLAATLEGVKGEAARTYTHVSTLPFVFSSTQAELAAKEQLEATLESIE